MCCLNKIIFTLNLSLKHCNKLKHVMNCWYRCTKCEKLKKKTCKDVKQIEVRHYNSLNKCKDTKTNSETAISHPHCLMLCT